MAMTPRVIVNDSTGIAIYQPQIDSWDGRQAMGRNVVSIHSAGQTRPIFGVITFRAIPLVDKMKGTVALEDVQVLDGEFPSARQQTQEYLRMVRATFPKELDGLSLERLESSFDFESPRVAKYGRPLENTPPKIIFSSKPAILVYIDGPPVYRPVASTSLQRVLNSPMVLLKDQSGEMYLHVQDGYLKAPSLGGPWTVADEPPPGAAEAERQAAASVAPTELLRGQTNSTANRPPPLTKSAAPDIYVSSTPAELVLFDGPPNFVPIAGTHLLYVANTTGHVFKSLSDQQTYLLISGRWYRAPSLEGPWQFVRADHLPSDFAQIPDNSPKENVKASVPGTMQADEALIANAIPQSAKVPRSTQMQDPRIDGPPRLEPIPGTDLYHVANSATPIIKVDNYSWYACQNGVWFTANSLNGPWTVAIYVPAVIYSIPPSSPLHYVTYVQVYGATPEEVYVGYTPGYLGTEVEDGVVVYGTGYYYPPWVDYAWYGWPCTWGLGWGPCWTPWHDWCFDYGFGWGCGSGHFGWWHCHPPRPWWGPCRDRLDHAVAAWNRGDTASTAGNIYARPDPTTAGRPLAADFGRAYNSRTGALAAGQRAAVQNVYTGFDGLAARGGNVARRPGRAGTMRGSGEPRFFSSDTAGRWSGYSRDGSYSRGYSHSGVHSPGGRGDGRHGGGHSGGHGGGGGGGHGGANGH
jgi:hypothetical protein